MVVNSEHEDMTINMYSAKFDRLSRFTLHFVPTEDDKADKFKQGLRSGMKAKFVTERIKTMEVVLDRATLAEDFWTKSKQKRDSSAIPVDDGVPSKKQKN